MARAHVDPEAWARKVRRRWILAITLAALLLVGIGVYYLLRDRILPARRYRQAEQSLERGAVTEAIDGFSLLEDYRDARARASALAYGLQGDDSFARSFAAAKLGDVLSFGRFEQDGNPDNGPEPIRWFVLAEGEGRLLLWSESVLDRQPFHERAEDITWADSSLRTWLNDSFYTQAFTPEERALIAMTRVETPGNSASRTRGGRDSRDHVYILSFNELLAFSAFNPRLEGLWAYPTPYALQRGVTRQQQYGTCCWWLRLPGVKQDCAGYCDMAGKPLYSGKANARYIGVRPVIWVFLP